MLEQKIYIIKFLNKNNENKIRAFKHKIDARRCYYDSALNLLLETFKEEILNVIHTDIKNAMSDCYNEILNFCNKVEKFNDCVDFDNFDEEDMEISLITEGIQQPTNLKIRGLW